MFFVRPEHRPHQDGKNENDYEGNKRPYVRFHKSTRGEIVVEHYAKDERAKSGEKQYLDKGKLVTDYLS
jgi:hypothetical protein